MSNLAFVTIAFCTGGTLASIYHRQPWWAVFYISLIAAMLQVEKSVRNDEEER